MNLILNEALFYQKKREKISFPPKGNQCILVLHDEEISGEIGRQRLGRPGYPAIG